MSSTNFAIDLSNYPNLYELFLKDKNHFARLVKGTLMNLDHAVKEGYHDTAKSYFNLDYTELEKALLHALFDYNGIIDHHENEAEKDSMKVLQHEMNPLAILSGKAYAIDSKGNHVPKDEWYHTEDIVQFFQSILYASRFVPLKDLASYLLLGQYELVDVLKARNFEKLSRIQPALRYQQEHGLVVGKLIEGTGFFDCGEHSKSKSECPSCRELLQTNEKISYCPTCNAGFNVV